MPYLLMVSASALAVRLEKKKVPRWGKVLHLYL